MAQQTAAEGLWSETNGPLTDKLVAALPPPAKGNRVRWDGGSGFGVRVTSAGARAFVLRYRNAGGCDRTLTIGSSPAWNVAKARKYAAELRQQIDRGHDPLAERQAVRAAPTTDELADRFEAEHLPKKRPATARDYKALLRKHIRPTLGSLKVAAVSFRDVERMHQRIAERAPYLANRTLAVTSKMFSLAVRWGLRPDNPTRGIERAPEQKCERYLTAPEIARLSAVLATHPERVSANVVRLLLLTGARKGETLAARWQDFDFAAGAWNKPAHTTKTAKLHRVPLSAPALALLTEMRIEAERENARRDRDGLAPIEWLFPSVGGAPLGDIKHFWASVCRTAGISGVRPHDLRHSYASILASSGLSLPIIGALLGHTQAATTQRYAHLFDDPLRVATDRAGAFIAAATNGAGGSPSNSFDASPRPGAEIVRHPRARARGAG